MCIFNRISMISGLCQCVCSLHLERVEREEAGCHAGSASSKGLQSFLSLCVCAAFILRGNGREEDGCPAARASSMLIGKRTNTQRDNGLGKRLQRRMRWVVVRQQHRPGQSAEHLQRHLPVAKRPSTSLSESCLLNVFIRSSILFSIGSAKVTCITD